MNKKYKRPLVVIYLLLVVLAILSVVYFIKLRNNAKMMESKVVDSIDGYSYTLSNLDSEYYGELFNELNELLTSGMVVQSEYAEIVAKLFVTDLYSMDTKINKYDIGGEEYYHSEKLEMYKLKVADTFYNGMKDNTYSDREQKLPLVDNVDVTDSDVSTYMLGNTEVNSYVVTLKWSYTKNLGYDDEGVVTLVDNDGIVQVVEYVPSEG